MKVANNIDILLATFNGERYVKQQIESILAQTIDNWRLLVRDDCSTDHTKEIIDSYSSKYPQKILVLDNHSENLGSCQNFACLLEACTADYIMFCDQDDVWLPNKVAVMMEKMRTMEASFGLTTPLMVYTDLKVVNEDLEPIVGSFWQHLSINPDNGNKLNRLVLQSVANGCAMMINKSLKDMALPIPVNAVMHDWWLTLVVASFGRSDYIPEPTILYRQHGLNVCGAGKLDFTQLVCDFCNPVKRHDTTLQRNKIFAARQKQAEVFHDRYERLLTVKAKRMLKDFLDLNKRGFFMRKYLILKNRFLYGNLMDNIGMLLFR